MNSITRNFTAAPVRDRSPVRIGERLASVRNFFEQAHARRPRQEYWQWLRLQIRQNRENGF